MSPTEHGRRGRLLFDPGWEGEVLLERRYTEWLGVGLATEPTDRGRAEGLLRRVYGLAKAEPGVFVHAASPHAVLTQFRKFTRERSDLALRRGPVRELLEGQDLFRECIRPSWTLRLRTRLQRSVTEGFHRAVWAAAFREARPVK